jgi:hypothetical protein
MEVAMTALRSTLIAACLAAATVALWPAEALAQREGRPAVARRAPATRIVVVARPVVLPSWRVSPWGWYPPYRYPYAYYGRYDDEASVRIEVPQRETEVYVDGYYAGIVDDFDGIFQRLRVEPGEHEIGLYLPGHATLIERVYLQPRSSFRIARTMVPLTPGDPPATRPAAPGPQPARRGGGLPAGPIIERPRAPRVDRAVETAEAFGTLALQVQPADAEVLIDGESWQRSGTTRLLLELAAGAHRVEVRRDGYLPFEAQVVVAAGETTTLNVGLSPAGAVR